MQPKIALRPDSSVVERGPEKAGVGGSIPSLATTSHLVQNSRPRSSRASAQWSPAALKRRSRRRFNPVSGHHFSLGSELQAALQQSLGSVVARGPEEALASAVQS